MTTWRSGSVEVAGGRLTYHRTGGDGPPLVLSHGLTDNGLCWSRFAAAVELDFDAIMLDARGHGGSAKAPSDMRHEPAWDIAAAIDQLGLERPIVMGHSIGARATADYAGSYPDRVSRVVLEDPAFMPIPDPDAAEARRARFRRHVETFQSMTEADIIAMGKANSPQWHADDFPAWAASKKQVDPDAMPSFGAPWQDSVAKITAPTLVLHGEVDRGSLMTAGILAEIAAVNPGIKAVRIAGAGHNTRRENFAEFLRVAREFLGSP